ncbi:hypothetical protein Tco_0912175 [Tanacetum coccineum]
MNSCLPLPKLEEIFVATFALMGLRLAFISVDADAGGASTTNIGLEAGHGSGTLEERALAARSLYLILRSFGGSFKIGEEIVKIDQNPFISLVQDEGTSWIQEDAEIQGKTSADTEILLDQEEPTELVEDLGSGEKGEKEISTANISVSTASATPKVSIAAENLVYIRRSAEKRKDKGKAIMKEDESVQKKSKKQLEQERLGHEEAIRLQEQINEEEKQRIARDAKIAKYDPAVLRYHALQNRSFSVAEVRKNMCMYLKNQGGYKQSHFKGMSYEDIRPIFERVWDQNNAFVPKDSEIEKEVMKRPGFDFQQKSSKKRSREDSDEDNAKKQKLEDDAEKEELRDSMDVVPRDDIAIDIESLATKYPIVDWKTHVLTENMMYYQIIRADGSSKNYKIFSEMLDDFDRQDVLDLHRLVQERMLSRRLEVDQESEMAFELLRKYWKIIKVRNHTEVYEFFDDMLKAFDRDDPVKLWSLVKERFSSTDPTDDKERTLWVDLKRLFKLDANDKLWKLQSLATWDERLEIVEVKVSSFVGISKRSPGSSISMSLTCCFNSLISPDISVIFEGSSFSLVGKQLAKSCEAKSLYSSGFKEVTRSLVSWLMSGYEGLAFIEATSVLAFAFDYSNSTF